MFSAVHFHDMTAEERYDIRINERPFAKLDAADLETMIKSSF